MKQFIHEVKINWENDPCAEKAVEWLLSNKLRADRDWQIDMHGGQQDHTSFWFHDLSKALIFKLTIGGM